MSTKQEAGQAVKDWVVSNFRVSKSDVEVTALDYENYATVTVNTDWPGFTQSDVRRAVEDAGISVQSIPECTDNTVSVVPA